MNFFSIEFSFIFLVFLIIYWNIKNLTLQNLCILLLNYILVYIFGGIAAFFTLLFYTFFIHFAALFIAHKKNHFALLSSIFLSICILCFFKYYTSLKDFFSQIFISIGFSSIQADVLMPLGLSFYVFTSITYLYSVFQEEENEPTLNPSLQSFESLMVYLSFFPTFIAGPIMRAPFFFEQLHQKRIWDKSMVPTILVLLIFGIFKKIIIANYAGIYSTPILQDPTHQDTFHLILALYGYAIQIYCDFSGYVNLVSAFALMIGFHLPPNFNMPYTARNLKDFWARWHISLSTFIRDFIYIPLGGNKKGILLTQIFVLISFGLSGIWHGNTINFLIWGILHGLGIVFINILRHYNISFKKVPLLPKLITFHYVCFCWIFFYYDQFQESLDFIKTLSFGFYFNSGQLSILLIALLGFIIYQFFIDFFELCVKFFSLIPQKLLFIILIPIAFIIFTLMPNGIPNFIYAGF